MNYKKLTKNLRMILEVFGFCSLQILLDFLGRAGRIVGHGDGDVHPERYFTKNITHAILKIKGVRIVSEGDPQYYNIIDECPYPNSPYCGSNCVPHHKNISYITNQLEADIDPQSERAVYWTNHLEGGFCSHNNSQGVCIQLDENVYGAVLKGGHYVVQMMKMSTDDRTYELEICMTLVFIHELAHTFGIEEEYLSSEHDKTNDIQCVMETYEENIFDANKDFYEAAKNSGKNLFCSGCTNKLNILFTS